MIELTLTNLVQCFNDAHMRKSEYAAVAIETKGMECKELIITPYEDIDIKKDYYNKAYTEDLILKSSSDVKIVGFAYGDDFKQIESKLLCRDKINKIKGMLEAAKTCNCTYMAVIVSKDYREHIRIIHKSEIEIEANEFLELIDTFNENPKRSKCYISQREEILNVVCGSKSDIMKMTYFNY